MVNFSRRPISPAAVRACTAAKLLANLGLNASIRGALESLISSQLPLTRSKSRSMGFSHNAATPYWADVVGCTHPGPGPSGLEKDPAAWTNPVLQVRRWSTKSRVSHREALRRLSGTRHQDGGRHPACPQRRCAATQVNSRCRHGRSRDEIARPGLLVELAGRDDQPTTPHLCRIANSHNGALFELVTDCLVNGSRAVFDLERNRGEQGMGDAESSSDVNMTRSARRYPHSVDDRCVVVQDGRALV